MDEDDGHPRRQRLLGLPTGTAIRLLLVLRVITAVVIVARAEVIVDEGLARYNRVAASPVTPYRNFSVEWMPVQTVVVHAAGGDGLPATAARVALAALTAEVAVAAALVWGWGGRAAATYLLLGLPLVAVAYARLDLLAVALATWAFALGRRRRDGPAGATLGLAALSGPWAAFLLPWAALRRGRPTLVGAAAILGLGGAAWYLVGGPKGPMQVLSCRGATGWDVRSSVGSALDALTGGATFLEGGIVRIGFAPAWARSLLLLGIVAATAAAWRRWRPDRDDPAAATALAVTASILALSPTYPSAWSTILLPWAALTWDEDRSLAGGAVTAVVLTAGLEMVAPAEGTTALSTWIVLARQVVLLGVAARALTSRSADRRARRAA